MATVIRKEKYQRGPFGTLVKWVFIAFNLLMLVCLISGLNSVSGIATHSEAERIGRDIGATIGVSMVLTLWIMGDIILGVAVLLTRGDKVIVEETIGEGPSRSSSHFGKEPDDSWARNIDQKIDRSVQETRQRSSTVGPVAQLTPTAGFGKRRQGS
jgi:hypothetical protein